MSGVKLVLEGPVLVAVGYLLVVLGFVLAGYAVERVIDARRRWAQRDRELAVNEAFHALRYPRAAGKSPAGDGRSGCGTCHPGIRIREGERC